MNTYYNSGHLDVYLSISNNLNVTENLITTSESDLSIPNNVGITDNLISDKSIKQCCIRHIDRTRSKQFSVNSKQVKKMF